MIFLVFFFWGCFWIILEK